MSSPASRRTRQSRESATASPARSTRSRQQPATSSPTPREQLQTTPRASRRIRDEVAVPASSPMFFPSSPSRGNDSNAPTPDVRMDEPSSPVRAPSAADGDMTPRGNGAAMRGMRYWIQFYPNMAPIIDNLPDSSPVQYVSSSSPTRSHNRGQRSEIPSSSSGLFVSSQYGAGGRASRRNDLHSGGLGSTPSRRRRVFVDGNGMPVADGEPRSDATFSNIHPDTSEAEALGGSSTRVIWGTNISIQDSMSAFKNSLSLYLCVPPPTRRMLRRAPSPNTLSMPSASSARTESANSLPSTSTLL